MSYFIRFRGFLRRSHTTSSPNDMIGLVVTCGYRPFSAMLSRSEALQK